MQTIKLLMYFFFFNDTATTEIYTLSLHDALPISGDRGDLLAKTLEELLGGLAPLGPRQLLDRHEMLQFGRLDHIKERKPAAGMRGAAGGGAPRDSMLRGLVDDGEQTPPRRALRPRPTPRSR